MDPSRAWGQGRPRGQARRGEIRVRNRERLGNRLGNQGGPLPAAERRGDVAMLRIIAPGTLMSAKPLRRACPSVLPGPVSESDARGGATGPHGAGTPGADRAARAGGLARSAASGRVLGPA